MWQVKPLGVSGNDLEVHSALLGKFDKLMVLILAAEVFLGKLAWKLILLMQVEMGGLCHHTVKALLLHSSKVVSIHQQ